MVRFDSELAIPALADEQKSENKSFSENKDVNEYMYNKSPEDINFIKLQNNLNSCLSIIDNEVMKNYIQTLNKCEVFPFNDELLNELNEDTKFIQFFRITELVYQDNEFSVHKLATIFNSLSNKPCTLVLMIRSDGLTNNFYLGIRSRGEHSTGTMRKLLEQSLVGFFPGSDTDEYLKENLIADLSSLTINCISSVTSIADYKQNKESIDNNEYIQGLEKFIYSMQGKMFTAICIANNLEYHDLVEIRKEYERIYTLMSPFANMQYNYVINKSSGTSQSTTKNEVKTNTNGKSSGVNYSKTKSDSETHGQSSSRTETITKGNNFSFGQGKSHTDSETEGTNDSETTSKGKSVNVGVETKLSNFIAVNTGISSSVTRSKTHGVSHSNSISESISKNLTFGINSSKSIGNSTGENNSFTMTDSHGYGVQINENEGYSVSNGLAYTQALTDTFGSSQAVTLNVQNKSLNNMLDRLEKQLKRIDECESSGMWDFAAYFLGESAAEVETAANMYHSLISGNQSGLEIAAVNTWTDRFKVKEIFKYIKNFLHPVFRFKFNEGEFSRETLVDATALSSTNELAIQLGLPRKSIKGLPVTNHVSFAQEVLSFSGDNDDTQKILLGKINHFGKETASDVELDLQSLSMHAFITGSTGSGKSNTVYQILSEVRKENIKFLVIEPAKGEYKNIFGQFNDVSVYGTNPKKTKLLKINPFRFPQDIHVLEHLDRLVEIFNACWPMYAAMPAILKEAIENAYVIAGWDLITSENIKGEIFPNFKDVLEQISVVINSSEYSSDSKGDYSGALLTRVRSLTTGLNGLIFCDEDLCDEDLFDKNVIIDLSRVGSMETKSLIMGLLVMKLNEYRMTSEKINSPLSHITVLEEAHNLFKRTSVEQSSESSNLLGKSVELLANSIAEMRTYGEGFIIADQSPGLLDMSVIRNTNTKIILRLPEKSDRELVGFAASLNDMQIDELARLRKGVAAVYQNDWLEPVLVQVNKCEIEEQSFNYVYDEKIDDLNDIRSQLLNFILQGRIDEKLDFDIQMIEKRLKSLGLTKANYHLIKELIYEYKLNDKLEIWKDNNFSQLSKLVTNLFGVESRIESCVRSAKNNDQLTDMLMKIVFQISPEVSLSKVLVLCQCFMKNMSICEDEQEQREKIYENWIDSIYERSKCL